MPNELNTNTRLRKALFLDRDGVINVNHGYVYKKEDFTLIDGIIDLIKKANELAYLVIVVTNQSGIGRGLYTEQQFHELNDWMIDLFAQNNAHIDKVYYCPHHPTEALGQYAKSCECRKPKPGMALAALDDFNIDITNSVMVGDKTTDLEFAMRANIPEVYWFSSDQEVFITENHSSTIVTKIEHLAQINLR
jgi:D-glycero-D-manno-heptose 1,7-bisphosphate phosphatase